MSVARVVLTEQDKKTVKAALQIVRRTSPEAAAIIGRLLRATAEPTGPRVDPFASVREVAEAFSVTEQTVRNWVDRGWLPGSRRLGRGPRRIPRSVLASAEALARPRPPAPDLSPAEMDAILSSPRRKVAK
jgi:excisionase family DNA binding protein